MGLDMKMKKKLTEETAKRYCTAGKKQKTKILDEFIATTGYNRKYAIHVLKNSAYVKVTQHYNICELLKTYICPIIIKYCFNYFCGGI